MSEKQDLESRVKVLGNQKKLWKCFCALWFILLLVLSGVFLKSQKPATSALQKEYKFLDPALRLINRKDLITNIQPIRAYYQQLEKDNREEFNIAIYFEYYHTGANVNINNDFKIWPASLTKLPLAMVVMKKVEERQWNLNDELVLLEEDLDEKSGSLYEVSSIGMRFTVEALVKKLLIDSDNTAYKILYRNIVEEDYRKLIASIGLEELFNKEGKISPKEYSRLLRALYYSTFLETENSERILNLLTQATFSNYLSKGLPQEIKFAHKYGENMDYNLFSDFGIVYAENRPYLLAVSIEGKTSDKEKNIKTVEALMENISKKTYEYISNY